MKVHLGLIYICLVGFISYPHAKAYSDVEAPYLSIKCYVELIDDSRTVSYWYTHQPNMGKFSLRIIGEVVANSSEVDMAITKVFQCIPESKEFNDYRARTIEKKQVR